MTSAASGPCKAMSAAVVALESAWPCRSSRLRDEGEVGVLRPGVDDDVESALFVRSRGPADIRSSTMPPVLVEKQGVAQLTRLQARDVAADQTAR
jgi:hypothetical protein